MKIIDYIIEGLPFLFVSLLISMILILIYEHFINVYNVYSRYKINLDYVPNSLPTKKAKKYVLLLTIVIFVGYIFIQKQIYNANNYEGMYYLYVFTNEDNVKCYKLPTAIRVYDDGMYETIIHIGYSNWPNGGYIEYDQELGLEQALNGCYIEDINGDEYYIEFKNEKVAN